MIKKRKPKECIQGCRCYADKKVLCFDCQFYRFIDSGYGYCMGLPTTTVVPWCKDPCALYKKKND